MVNAKRQRSPRDYDYPSFAARCFQFLRKIEQNCVSIKGQNNFALSSSMHSFFQQNKNANLTFVVNVVLHLSNAKLKEM